MLGLSDTGHVSAPPSHHREFLRCLSISIVRHLSYHVSLEFTLPYAYLGPSPLQVPSALSSAGTSHKQSSSAVHSSASLAQVSPFELGPSLRVTAGQDTAQQPSIFVERLCVCLPRLCCCPFTFLTSEYPFSLGYRSLSWRGYLMWHDVGLGCEP